MLILMLRLWLIVHQAMLSLRDPRVLEYQWQSCSCLTLQQQQQPHE